MKPILLKTHTRTLFAPTLIATALSSPLVFAGFTFVDNSGIAGAGVSYTTGTTETFVVRKPNPANHITTEFSANVNGTVSTDLVPVVSGATPHKKIWFTNADIVLAGTPMTLCFDFSHVIQSDGDGTLGNTTAAIELRWFENTPGVSIDVNLTGGLDTFQNTLGNEAGPLTPNPANDVIFTVSGVARSKGLNTTYNGFSDADTANYSAPAIAVGENGMFNLVDTQQASSDFSFQKATFTITPDTDMAAGTAFQFTFGGADVVPVPEPTSTVLLGLGGLAMILRRRK